MRPSRNMTASLRSRSDPEPRLKARSCRLFSFDMCVSHPAAAAGFREILRENKGITIADVLYSPHTFQDTL